MADCTLVLLASSLRHGGRFLNRCQPLFANQMPIFPPLVRSCGLSRRVCLDFNPTLPAQFVVPRKCPPSRTRIAIVTVVTAARACRRCWVWSRSDRTTVAGAWMPRLEFQPTLRNAAGWTALRPGLESRFVPREAKASFVALILVRVCGKGRKKIIQIADRTEYQFR